MPPEKQRILAHSIQEQVSGLTDENAVALMALIAGDAKLKQQLLRTIVRTVEQQVNVQVSNFDIQPDDIGQWINEISLNETIFVKLDCLCARAHETGPICVQCFLFHDNDRK